MDIKGLITAILVVLTLAVTQVIYHNTLENPRHLHLLLCLQGHEVEGANCHEH